MGVAHGTRATVQAYAAALDRGDVDALMDLIAADVIGHEPTQDVVGVDAFKRNIEGWLFGHSDARVTTEDLLEDGDRAAWRWRFEGTHAASGRRITVEGIILFRMEHGRIAEYWGHYDRVGLLEQQGAR